MSLLRAARRPQGRLLLRTLCGDGLPALPNMDVVSRVPALLDSEDKGMALEHVNLADEIYERATEVREDREWTSLFEPVVFAFLRKRSVHVCFGPQVLNLVQLFAPWFALSMDNSKTPIRLLGCVVVGANLQVAKITSRPAQRLERV